MKVVNETEKKCRWINPHTKQRMVRAKHNWVVSCFDKRYSVCQDCGHGKKN